MRLMLHDNNLNVRGTSTAVYDYATNLKRHHNVECFISYDVNDRINDNRIINKFKQEFEVFGYNNFSEVDQYIKSNNIDAVYLIKSGNPDGKVSKLVPNYIHAVFPINTQDIHGEKYSFVSSWLSEDFFSRSGKKVPHVPHMLNLPDSEQNYRKALKIDEENIVIGRYGGLDSFDIPFVIESIKQIVNNNKNIKFLFCNTFKFIDHPNVIFTNSLASLTEKVKFLNTIDAFLHARYRGESFGLSILEAMSKGLPIYTYDNSPEKNHYKLLSSKGLLYNNKEQLVEMIMNFKKEKVEYNIQEFLPDVVTKKFIEVYLNER
jgi:glycosyltransferase involved in cell wall biosynthesis